MGDAERDKKRNDFLCLTNGLRGKEYKTGRRKRTHEEVGFRRGCISRNGFSTLMGKGRRQVISAGGESTLNGTGGSS